MTITTRLLDSDNPDRLLIVEGPDDFHTMMSLLKHHNIPKTFVVKEAGGIDRLMRQWKLRLKANNETHLGVIVDADTDIQARWQSLRNNMIQAGYKTTPTIPDANGTVIIEDATHVGVWLMPDNIIPGTLEQFVHYLVPQTDMLWSRVEACVQAIPDSERRFPTQYLEKVHLHTWLAWQREPGQPIGQAVTSTFLDANAPHAQQLIDWLRRLFQL